jgi:hypothetical protein
MWHVCGLVVLSCAVLCWVCRNNTSDYYVNNKRMNVKEVTTLLKSKGIDLDNNRFLILQVQTGHTLIAPSHIHASAGVSEQKACMNCQDSQCFLR